MVLIGSFYDRTFHRISLFPRGQCLSLEHLVGWNTSPVQHRHAAGLCLGPLARKRQEGLNPTQGKVKDEEREERGH